MAGLFGDVFGQLSVQTGLLCKPPDLVCKSFWGGRVSEQSVDLMRDLLAQAAYRSCNHGQAVAKRQGNNARLTGFAVAHRNNVVRRNDARYISVVYPEVVECGVQALQTGPEAAKVALPKYADLDV